MAITLGTLFLIAAFVCFILAACSVPKFNWVPIGLAFWVASTLLGGIVLH